VGIGVNSIGFLFDFSHIYQDSHKKNLQMAILMELINEIKKKLRENHDNYCVELKYNSIVNLFDFPLFI